MSSIWCDVWGMWPGEPLQCKVCRAPRQRLSRREEQSNGQASQVKSKHFNHNYKYRKTCIETKISTISFYNSIETKISTISFYNSIDIRFKLGTGKSKNYIPFHLCKRLFPKVNDSAYIKQPKMCKVKLRHNDKERDMQVFCSTQWQPSAVLGMQDIDRLDMLSTNRNSEKRQVAVPEEDNKDKGKSPRPTQKWQIGAVKRQDAGNRNTKQTGCQGC